MVLTLFEIILDMKRFLVNLVKKVEINFSNVYINQQRSIQTSTYRLQSVEEVILILIYLIIDCCFFCLIASSRTTETK